MPRRHKKHLRNGPRPQRTAPERSPALWAGNTRLPGKPSLPRSLRDGRGGSLEFPPSPTRTRTQALPPPRSPEPHALLLGELDAFAASSHRVVELLIARSHVLRIVLALHMLAQQLAKLLALGRVPYQLDTQRGQP